MRSPSRSQKMVLILMAIVAVVIAVVGGYIHSHTLSVFSPHGLIAQQERRVMFIALSLALLVVVPVFGLLFGIAWKYRADNQNAAYTPDWDHSRKLETIWWGVPLLLILALSVVAWQGSHTLDPRRAIASSVPPLTIQVVALQWKWLFIYPEQNVASVNDLMLPVDRPVRFEITSDAPMNSFWIPALGGQIYAMTGMSTELNLMANKAGSYRGVSANLSGTGFAGMHFMTVVGTEDEFNVWVSQAHQAKDVLNDAHYDELAKPTKNVAPQYYWAVDSGLYDSIVARYSGAHSESGHHTTEGEH